MFYSGDRDTRWIVKANKSYYGYKLHMTIDPNHEFITGVKITSTNCADTKEIIPLV